MNTSINQRAGCANAAVLQRYIDDQLDPQEEADLEAHLSTCQACQKSLEDSRGNAEWWKEMRGEFLDGFSPDGSKPAGNPIGHEMLELLSPTDNPRMLGRIGHYEIQGIIGQGSAGVVLRALDPRLNRTVAIKVLAPAFVASSPARTRFEREAKSVAAVAHDHVVPIHAVDEHRGLPYIVMQYVSSSLRVRFQQAAPLATREVTRIGMQIARALSAAHAQGIVHRDVKPANVLVEGSIDRILVTDFGLASVAGDASMTFSGTIHGTPHYMSPEQARGESVDARSDLFSLGSLLYEACTGRPPFQAQTVFGVIRRVCETEPTPIREMNPEIDEWLAQLIDRLMEKDADVRFQSANAAGNALAAELAYLQNPIGTERPERAWLPVPASRRQSRRWITPTFVVAGCLAFSLGGLGYLAMSAIKDREDESGLAISQSAEEFNHDSETTHSNPDIRTVRRTLNDVAGQAFSVRVVFGDVTILPSQTQDIHVELSGLVAAETEDASASIFEAHPIALEQTGQGVTLSGILEEREHWESLHYTVTVPVGTNIDVTNSTGDLIIGPSSGTVHAEVDGGDVDIGFVQGSVDVKTTGGRIFLLDGCTGDADLVAVLGDVMMAGIEGDGFAITSGGDVWIGQSPGEVGAQTSGGSIFIDGVLGAVRAHATGGNIQLWVPQTLRENVHANAANGDVTLMIADDVDATITASGQLGSIHEFDWDTTEDDVGAIWATTTLNEGGPTIQLSSMSGSIEIEQFDPSDGTLQNALEWPSRTASVSNRLARTSNQTDSKTDSIGPSGGASPSDPGLGGSGSSLGGSSLGGSGTGLGGSGLGGSELGGSGLGGSGSSLGSSRLGGSGRGSTSGETSGQGTNSEAGRRGSSGTRQNETPLPGVLTTVSVGDADASIDGYTIFLPINHSTERERYPVLVFLQGAFGVGGPIERVNDWGLTRLLRDETDLSSRRNQLLLDGFIVVNPHIQSGGFDDNPEVVQQIIDDVIAQHHGDRSRVYLTGLSLGARGTYGLAELLPNTFAAIAPIAGRSNHVNDWSGYSGTAVWISHNNPDGRVSFEHAQSAVNGIESSLGVEFREYDRLRVNGTDFLDQRHILTAAPTRSHDAWTEIYSHAEFYEWLLQHEL